MHILQRRQIAKYVFLVYFVMSFESRKNYKYFREILQPFFLSSKLVNKINYLYSDIYSSNYIFHIYLKVETVEI